MTITQLPEAVISELPDWQGASYSALSGGLTNRTWLIEKNDRRAVLKIDDCARTAPYNERRAEADLQMIAANAGLANKVLFASEQLYLTEFVEGTVWDPGRLDQEGKIEQLASSLRRLHSLPRSGRSFDAPGAAEGYVRSIEYPDNKLISVCLDVIQKVRLPTYLCCCHNDLVAENIIATPELRFLDWEYACDNDPLFDLATIVEHHELSEGQSRALLDAYFEGAGERWYPRLAEQQQLYLALFWLWLAARPDRSEKALKCLGARVTTSCS
ncbi:MAG: phosphotransferase [Gammaproteobacteria bacterium]|nr:phosphotransferase [Gammaproteobacteria bacterium]